MRRFAVTAIIPVIAVLVIAGSLMPARSQPADIATRADALLRDRCYECHAPGGHGMAAAAALAAFNVTDAAQLKDKAGAPGRSRILLRVNHKSAFMPPANSAKPGPLPAADISLLTDWIAQGAPLVPASALSGGASCSGVRTPAMPPDIGTQAFAILQSRCFECHTPGGAHPRDSEAVQRLDMSNARQLKSFAGTPDQSRILEVVRSRGEEDDFMPPADATVPGPLPAQDVAALTEWIAQGAPDPAPVVPPATCAAPLPGDVNGDGVVTTADAILALRIAIGLLSPTIAQLSAADANRDGRVSLADVAIILQRAVGLTSPGLSRIQ